MGVMTYTLLYDYCNNFKSYSREDKSDGSVGEIPSRLK